MSFCMFVATALVGSIIGAYFAFRKFKSSVNRVIQYGLEKNFMEIRDAYWDLNFRHANLANRVDSMREGIKK